MLVWIVAAGVANAGCAVDADREARQAAADLVVAGTIVGLELVEGGGEVVVFQRLRVDREYEGHVRSGEIRLRSGLPWRGCPGGYVSAPGQRVYAIGTPDEDQAIAVSACTNDVGLSDGDDTWLAGVGDEGSKRSFPGVTPLPARRPAPLPKATATRVRTASRVGTIDGSLVRDEGSRVAALWETDGLVLLDTLDERSLARVLTTATPLAAGAALSWLPGVDVGPGGEVSVAGDLQATGVVPPGVVGDRWVPSRPAVPDGDLVHAARETGLRATPDGPDLVRVGQYANLLATGPAEGGWLPVWLDSEVIAGPAWARADDIAADGMGYGTGSGYGGREYRIALREGTALEAPEGPTIGYVARDTMVTWVAAAEDRAWVVLEAPSGPRLAEIRCDADRYPDGCDPR